MLTDTKLDQHRKVRDEHKNIYHKRIWQVSSSQPNWAKVLDEFAGSLLQSQNPVHLEDCAYGIGGIKRG